MPATLRERLRAAGAPLLEKIKDHPFFAGLRDGSLPGEALLHFARQDADFLLPAYGRGLARCAALTHDHTHALVLARMAVGTLEARQAMALGYDLMAAELERAGDASWRTRPADPSTHAYTSFFAAASASSLAEGIGALLPCSWFYLQIADDLRERHDPGARYAQWVSALHPGEDYREVLEGFLTLVDDLGESCSAGELERLEGNFALAARYEWGFVDAALRRLDWPV
ncbi:TenA family protein [Kitasatospora aureofaciens]|uniref:TenA family protein n=1 Tax=Kitasatospora aureofaciens TaxID=1894 RepID=UPI001C44A135|nr:TenA family transcriptional regulator [Kitasatospora aureofaciens]MBV6696713.1 TenA family transcriptional regulator [Kitasatospora aureofaciens]